MMTLLHIYFLDCCVTEHTPPPMMYLFLSLSLSISLLLSIYYAFSPKFPLILLKFVRSIFFAFCYLLQMHKKTVYYAPAEAPCPYGVYYFAFPFLLSGSVQIDEPDVYNVCLSDFIIGT